jgi:hypothetical protein
MKETYVIRFRRWGSKEVQTIEYEAVSAGKAEEYFWDELEGPEVDIHGVELKTG